MPHFITTHSINNPNYIKMQQNKNQQLDAKFRKFIKVLIMPTMILSTYTTMVLEFRKKTKRRFSRSLSVHRPLNKPEKEALQDSD